MRRAALRGLGFSVRLPDHCQEALEADATMMVRTTTVVHSVLVAFF